MEQATSVETSAIMVVVVVLLDRPLVPVLRRLDAPAVTEELLEAELNRKKRAYERPETPRGWSDEAVPFSGRMQLFLDGVLSSLGHKTATVNTEALVAASFVPDTLREYQAEQRREGTTTAAVSLALYLASVLGETKVVLVTDHDLSRLQLRLGKLARRGFVLGHMNRVKSQSDKDLFTVACPWSDETILIVDMASADPEVIPVVRQVRTRSQLAAKDVRCKPRLTIRFSGPFEQQQQPSEAKKIKE